jgi:hypothetical protein
MTQNTLTFVLKMQKETFRFLLNTHRTDEGILYLGIEEQSRLAKLPLFPNNNNVSVSWGIIFTLQYTDITL